MTIATEYVVNTVDWMNAIENHPETWCVDLVVGASIALGGSTVVEGVRDQDVAVSIDELVRLGFLHEEFSGPCTSDCDADCREVVLVLRMPSRVPSPERRVFIV